MFSRRRIRWPRSDADVASTLVATTEPILNPLHLASPLAPHVCAQVRRWLARRSLARRGVSYGVQTLVVLFALVPFARVPIARVPFARVPFARVPFALVPFALVPFALVALLGPTAVVAAQDIGAERDIRAPGAAAPDLILHGGAIHTQAAPERTVRAIAIRDGRFLATGTDDAILRLADPSTRSIDLGGRTVIPGLNDSHLHVTRGGRFYNLELRFDGVTTLREGLRRIREQAARTPPGHWVRVVGGWSPFQFEERRMPTIAELNEAAPNTPVLVVFLYSKGFLNRAGVAALGLGPDTAAPTGTRIRIVDGGAELLAEPSPALLYQTIGRLPGVSDAEQVNATIHFCRELNRFGLTSAVDPGGGGHRFPDDYGATDAIARAGAMSLRLSYYLFAQDAGAEEREIGGWVDSQRIGLDRAAGLLNGYLLQGAGENLLWAAGDYENFMADPPTLDRSMDRRLESVLRLLLRHGWPVRIHATYDETVGRFLDVFERIDRELPLRGRRFALDHVETISDANLERLARLGGGVAIQNRMAFAGEYFLERYGAERTRRAPPLRALVDAGIPLGAGTDGTRVSSYNPWLALHWMVTGETLGGTVLNDATDRLTREEALSLYTVGSAWFSAEDGRKGRLAPGWFADLAVLDADYFTVPPADIRRIESVLTVVDGRIVHATGPYADLAPPLPPVLPEWSPVRSFGGYERGTPNDRADGK